MSDTAPAVPTAAAPAALRGWRLTLWATVATAAVCGLAFAVTGGGLEGWRALVRTSAKTSLGFFLAAFVASSARALWQDGLTRWLLANRRYLGVAFAASHAIHLVGILRIAALDPTFERGVTTLLFGGLGYGLLFAMAATSFDGAARRLGARRWKALHTTGMYYLWAIFLISYLPRALVESQWYWLPTVALLSGLGVRFAAWWRQSLRRR